MLVLLGATDAEGLRAALSVAVRILIGWTLLSVVAAVIWAIVMRRVPQREPGGQRRL